jgi:hypothetical protein
LAPGWPAFLSCCNVAIRSSRRSRVSDLFATSRTASASATSASQQLRTSVSRAAPQRPRATCCHCTGSNSKVCLPFRWSCSLIICACIASAQ